MWRWSWLDKTHVEILLNEFLQSLLFRCWKRVYRTNWRLCTLFQIDFEVIRIMRRENFSFCFAKNVSKFMILRRDIREISVKTIDGGLYFIFSSSYFIFIFIFSLFSFSIFRTARVRVDWSRCHISHKLMAKSQDWSRDWENLVEDSRTNNVIQYGHHMLTSWTTHGCLG